jgi:hypothetical protein
VKKWPILLIIALLGLPGQVLACGYECPQPIDTFCSSLDVLGTADSGFANGNTNFGYVKVDLFSTTSAKVTFLPSEQKGADYDFVLFADDAFLNVNGTAKATTNTWGWTISSTTPQDADIFGSFNIIAHHRLLNVDSVAINLTATNGTTWTKAADVLGDNGYGFDAAAYLYRDTGKLSDALCGGAKGWVGEVAPPPSGVPIPGAVLLLGAGLARITAYAKRRQD